MRIDLHAALHGALNVTIPDIDVSSIRDRSIRVARTHALRSARSMTAFGLLVACVAMFAAGSGAAAPPQQLAMHLAVPAPEPIST